jgi:hypothetical protein
MGVRLVSRRRNPEDELPTGEWIPAHAVRFNEDGSVSLMEGALTNRGRRANVAGYRDARGIFHPIRWDPEYDPDELSIPEGGSSTDYSAPRGFFVGGRRKPKPKKRSRRR